MAKRQSFADKASKKKDITMCPTCNQPVAHTLVVSPEPTANGKSFRMRSRLVGICKCNEKILSA
ncbi:MAG: hypothetical protein KKG33_01910 [candidate division Zixibacteria bacterium]|nr:hypothetical protein [candidate division Zixibacteria bacterium]MBU2624295.1 hypothetical protein [candidate division Zixibacteria bacterium]